MTWSTLENTSSFLYSTSLTSPIPSPPLLRLLPLLHLLNLPPPPHSSPAPSPSLFLLNLLLRLSSSLTLLRPVCQFVSRFRPLTNPQPSSGKETISPSSHCFRPKFPRLSLSLSLSLHLFIMCVFPPLIIATFCAKAAVDV